MGVVMGGELQCVRETDSPHAVACVQIHMLLSVLKQRKIVGHPPRTVFLWSYGTIKCTVTGN